ncbi:MAG: hypothetical protein AAF914_03220, partial [Pseudomonadota bacterium]
LTDDPGIWADLTARFRADMFCGVFLSGGNEGMSLSRQTIRSLAVRGLTIDFDIYDGKDDSPGQSTDPRHPASR